MIAVMQVPFKGARTVLFFNENAQQFPLEDLLKMVNTLQYAFALTNHLQCPWAHSDPCELRLGWRGERQLYVLRVCPLTQTDRT